LKEGSWRKEEMEGKKLKEGGNGRKEAEGRGTYTI
jgi:hypothetical protein